MAMADPHQQKLKVNGPSVITANRLGDGAVVYWTKSGDWTTKLADAAIVTTAPDATHLLAAAIADDVGAVGAYVAPVKRGEDGEVLPGNLRERIRLSGPTIELPITFGI
jgi:hypothetical protein